MDKSEIRKEMRARLRALTAFQRRVYDATRKIPCGRVMTYGELARCIGCWCPRAVGQALRVNPFAPGVPCHRVVAADGSLTGFQGKRDAAAFARKRRLLEAEGVRFNFNILSFHLLGEVVSTEFYADNRTKLCSSVSLCLNNHEEEKLNCRI